MKIIAKWLLPRLHSHWIHRAVRRGLDPDKTDRQLRFEWWLMTKSGSDISRDSSWGFDVGVALLVLALILGVACAPTHPEARHIVATTTTTVAPTTTTQAPAPAVSAVPRASRKAARPRGPSPSGAVATPVSGDVWDALARCETGMRNDTGDPYWGYFQFLPSTWRSLGYSGLPTDHSYATQREAATRLVARSGWGQFPGCARKLKMR